MSLPRFNTQPPEGGCQDIDELMSDWLVSTHSRPKAADGTGVRRNTALAFQHTAARRRLGFRTFTVHNRGVSTHSRPKAAVQPKPSVTIIDGVSTHSRPKAAVSVAEYGNMCLDVSTHSRPKAAG